MKTNVERFAPWVEQLLTVQDPAERAALVEVINGRTEDGCVVRALESALWVEATDEEWDMRIADIRQLREEFKLFEGINDPKFQSEVSLTRRLRDRQMILAFISRVREHDTPLGRGLRGYEMVEAVLGQDDIRDLVQLGTIVMIDVVRERKRHLVHVGLGGENFVSLNDDGTALNLDRRNKYPAFILNPLT